MLSVHQHWDPLKVCAVGRCYPPEFFSHIEHPKVRNTFEKIAQETEEDYQGLIKKLESFGVEVLRTDISEDLEIYKQGDVTYPTPPMTPRDYCGMIGDTFYMPSENYGDNIDVEQFINGFLGGGTSNVLSNFQNYPEIKKYIFDLFLPGRPVSDLVGNMLLQNYGRNGLEGNLLSLDDRENLKQLFIQAETMTIGSNDKTPNFKGYYAFNTIREYVKRTNNIIFDSYVNTACITRVGKDLYIGIGNYINKMYEKKYMDKWAKLFPGYRLNRVDYPGHIDGCFTPIKPGLVLSAKSVDVGHLFPDWEQVKIPESLAKSRFKKNRARLRGRYWVSGEEYNDEFNDYMDCYMNNWVNYAEETTFDINVLIVDENNVLCTDVNKEMFKVFERHGVTPHVVPFRHKSFWDGGLHCNTTDIHRDGEQQDYFPD